MKEGHNLQSSEIGQQCYKENKLTFRRRVHLDSAIVQTNKLQIKNQCTKFTHYQQHRQDIRMLSFKQYCEILKGTSYNNGNSTSPYTVTTRNHIISTFYV